MEIQIEGDWRKVQSTGEITIYGVLKGRKRSNLGYIQYIVGTEIILTDLQVNSHCRKQGLGRLLISIVQALALKLKIPIYVPDALNEALVFYEKVGFKPIMKCNIKIMNLNPCKLFREQVTKTDLIWIPKGLKEPIELYI